MIAFGCSKGIVRVVDAGGLTTRVPFFVMDLDALSETQLPGPTAAEYVKAKSEEGQAARRVKAEEQARMSAEESSSGKCSEARARRFEEVLPGLTTVMESDGFVRQWHEFGPATSTGAKFTHTATVAGEYHVLVAGFDAIKLTVADAKARTVSEGSPYERILAANGWFSGSRVFRSGAKERHSLEIAGTGCSLAMAFLKN
jgi:hypothetical protein